MTSIWDKFLHSASRWPDRPFLNVLAETAEIYAIESGEITYGAAAQTVHGYAAQIEAAGYQRGQRVMMLLENRPAFFLWWLAFNKLGISVVPVNPDLRQAEQSYMIDHAEPVLAISVHNRCAELQLAAQSVGSNIAVIPLGSDLPAVKSKLASAAKHGDAEAALLYTSGTTGQPKGCILTNAYFIEAGQWYAQTGGLCELSTDGERMITPLPIFHMNAMAYSFMAMIEVGGCLTALDRFHPKTWWASVRDSGATCLHYLGVMPSLLMAAEQMPSDRDHTVRFGFGAGVDPKRHAAFEERFGFPLTEAWAMTETGAGAVICANRVPRRIGESCLGKPEGDIEVRLVDDNGKEANQGELLVRRAGPDPRRGFFAGYFKNPDATAEAWDGGWFHTGDIVRRAPDGSMFFVDRKKNVIRRSGENIAAVEVESTLMRHPAVLSAAVSAVPDTLRGDEVFACIVLKEPATAEQITQWCLTQVAYYKAPGYIAFVDALPLTATQKLQRAELKTMALALLDDPATTDTRAFKKRGAA